MNPRVLLAALGLAALPFSSQAQDIELITEADVTFAIVFSTSITTTNGQTGAARRDTTRAYSSAAGNKEIIQALIDAEIIESETTTGWSLRAVAPAPADLFEVETDFYLYAVNEGSGQRVRVPSNFFGLQPRYSAEKAVTRHSTRNIISSNGVITNWVEVDVATSFERTNTPAVVTGPFTEIPSGNRYNLSTKTDTLFNVLSQSVAGFSNITFTTRSDPVFYFAISSLRFTGRGDFVGTYRNRVVATKDYTTRGVPDEILPAVIDDEATPASGLVTNFSLSYSGVRLIERSVYPEVEF